MSNTTPPEIGQDPWGADLNEYLESLEARVEAVEARPEHVYNTYPYKFNNGAPPALSGEVRLNNVNATLATLVDLHKTDGDGADRLLALQMLGLGARIRINDWDNASVAHIFDVTGPGIATSTNVQVPVTWDHGGGTLPTAGQAKVNVALLVVIPQF